MKQQYMTTLLAAKKEKVIIRIVERYSFFVGFKPEFNTENERKQCRGTSKKAEKEKR